MESKNNFSINIVLNAILSNLYNSKKTNMINIQNENISGILENFKDSKIIHMIRNPYTQINSRYLFGIKTQLIILAPILVIHLKKLYIVQTSIFI